MCKNDQEKFTRLPTFIKPSHYEIRIHPDLNDFTFSGSVLINLKVNLK
jgi:hypothetical protein